MLKALTFLGTGEYRPTTYVKHDDPNEICETHLFPEAVSKLYTPEQTVAFLTPSVKECKGDYLEHLQTKLGSKFCTKEIPNGHSANDLWQIFQICADSVDQNDEIILDITHAFRSLPLLIFTAAIYLRQVKSVHLKHIIYGAYDARDENTNLSPIFDLTPFVRLLDWTHAVNIFQNSGDARSIAGLAGDQSHIANVLTDLSAALFTNRALEAQDAAFKFNGLPFEEIQEFPLQILISQLRDNFQGMAVNEPHDNPGPSLKAQYLQIQWYIENQHYLQAITLIREWLVSWQCIQQDGGDWLSQGSRNKASEELNERVRNRNDKWKQELVKHSLAQRQQSQLIELWGQCSDIRNHLAHCGMVSTQVPKNAADAIQTIRDLFKKFKGFYDQIIEDENFASSFKPRHRQ